ncbi:hypothetical protein [Rhodoferax saidenbachensis]|uniref:Cation transport ATPase n=1 Tax=Rhodoferax saidenbachensis TaxID=1484693 RepID=A0ABU1ZHT4_9BURK|nr:hypothetical protein [Rhodoferax saidenbachensis]MDR7304938.1 cation transport ATPase [Rhodoferax saidenbachensis]
MDTQHTPILKRVGAVLLVVGLIDIAVMIYCIANRISYSSSFNIFAVIAGIFLLCGSLRAASLVRWFAVFMLAAFVALLIAWPFMQPFALTLTQFRLNPGTSFATFTFMVFVLGLLVWLFRELGREPVMAARASAGRKQRDMRIPAAAGVGLVIVMGTFMALLLGGESADRAKSIAEQQVGPGYRLHVSSLNIAKNNKGTFVSGVVTAWKDNEILDLPVHWEER